MCSIETELRLKCQECEGREEKENTQFKESALLLKDLLIND